MTSGLPEVLRTERLILRPFQDADVEFVLDMYSRWEVMQFLGAVPQPDLTLADAQARLERYRALAGVVHQGTAHDAGPRGIWAITDAVSGQLYGTALLKDLPASGELPLQDSGDVEIGWHLHPDAWGRGIATEAARAVLGHAFTGGWQRVLAVTYPENLASQRVARRIGMQDLGLSEAYYNLSCRLLEVRA